MKKIFCIFLAMAVCCTLFGGCSDAEKLEEDKEQLQEELDALGHVSKEDIHVRKALAAVKDYWADIYAKSKSGMESEIHIKNTRVIRLKPTAGECWDYLQDVAYAIDFEIYSDYFGSAPYYVNVGIGDMVLIKENGSISVEWSDAFHAYSQWCFSYDYSDLIESVEDCGSYYNQTIDVRK